MLLYHTPRGKYWHKDPRCRRVLSWQWERLKAHEINEWEEIKLKDRCKGCWND